MSETTMFCLVCNAHVYQDDNNRSICVHCDKSTSACVSTRPNEIYRKGMRRSLIQRGIREFLYYNFGISDPIRRDNILQFLKKQYELSYEDIDYNDIATKVLEAIYAIQNIKID